MEKEGREEFIDLFFFNILPRTITKERMLMATEPHINDHINYRTHDSSFDNKILNNLQTRCVALDVSVLTLHDNQTYYYCNKRLEVVNNI